MLQFDEMDPDKKIKIYNKYASYPDIKKNLKKFFHSKSKYLSRKNVIPKINFVSPMKLNYLKFFNSIKKEKKASHFRRLWLKGFRKLLEEIEKKN